MSTSYKLVPRSIEKERQRAYKNAIKNLAPLKESENILQKTAGFAIAASFACKDKMYFGPLDCVIKKSDLIGSIIFEHEGEEMNAKLYIDNRSRIKKVEMKIREAGSDAEFKTFVDRQEALRRRPFNERVASRSDPYWQPATKLSLLTTNEPVVKREQYADDSELAHAYATEYVRRLDSAQSIGSFAASIARSNFAPATYAKLQFPIDDSVFESLRLDWSDYLAVPTESPL